ncbi:head-tail connector protein [Pseudomonas fulva]|uniref:head-tail connector protein n=1 Tax=Pseudomonas fulva TaxID=47880 RepID=UPI0018AB2613|nr:head-tail connector protein [Pseudomonas fulva]MBF8694907.1 phage gp6-like head-tail connector protein [Pseudomonas fulva]
MSKVFWTPEQLRIQARLEPDDSSLDNQLDLYAKAAVRAIENATNRALFPADVPLPEGAPENALQANEDIVLAILMMVAHWFDNPGAVNIGNITSEIPLGFQFLVTPYRWYSL